jgi:O-antigen biosynthesis protein
VRVSPPTCSVVICTRDRPAELDRCLSAIRKIEYPSFEVLVVDNAPSEVTAREVAECWAARYVIEPQKGLSYARNRGAHESTSNVIAYLDDDAVPEPQWLSAIASEFEDPAVMAVAGRIIPLEPCAAEMSTFSATAGAAPGMARRIVNRGNPSWFELANFGGIGIGANMALRRAAFTEWPGFDVRLGRGAVIDGGEENYAFFALVERGFSVVYAPYAVVRHPIPVTLEELCSAHLHTLTTISAYVIFLFCCQPRYRTRLLRYIIGGMLGAPRTWRDQQVPHRRGPAPRASEIRAWLSGPLLYAKARFAWTRSSASQQVAEVKS